MIPEQRRRAYLDAMQVATWLPRTELPFAAASRLELLESQQEEAFEPVPEPVADYVAEAGRAGAADWL